MGDFFRGWYFKCQSDTQTLAVIPAIHESAGARACSIQLITQDGSWNFPFPASTLKEERHRISIGDNHFSPAGLRLNLHSEDLFVEGLLCFGPFSPIRYDIMGPFRYIPGMECRHSVFSMVHTVTGSLWLGNTPFTFREDLGYVEGDRGRSFPSRYAWTQTFFPGGSLMLSVAEIPLGRLSFTGAIAVIHLQGKEYRLATYLGAKVLRVSGGEIFLRQGSFMLTVRLLTQASKPLWAPAAGCMRRTIRESPSCRASYRLERKGKVLLEFETSRASFEYAYESP